MAIKVSSPLLVGLSLLLLLPSVKGKLANCKGLRTRPHVTFESAFVCMEETNQPSGNTATHANTGARRAYFMR